MPEIVICIVCREPIGHQEPRFADFNRASTCEHRARSGDASAPRPIRATPARVECVDLPLKRRRCTIGEPAREEVHGQD